MATVFAACSGRATMIPALRPVATGWPPLGAIGRIQVFRRAADMT